MKEHVCKTVPLAIPDVRVRILRKRSNFILSLMECVVTQTILFQNKFNIVLEIVFISITAYSMSNT
jgi:hypothetical protein